MAINNLGLGFIFTAKDFASAKMTRLDANLKKVGGNANKSAKMMKGGFAVAGASLVPLIAGVATLGGAFRAANAAASFQQNVERVGNISGATAVELKQLENAALDAGIATQFSPDDAVKGLESLSSMGFNAKESMSNLGQALSFAAAGQIGIEQAAETSGNAIKVFGDKVGNTATIADRLTKITSLTSLKAGELQQALGSVSRGAGSTGQNFSEMLVSMGLVRNAGVDVSVAAGSVSSALLALGKNQDKFKELGIEVTKADGTFRDFGDVVLEAENVLSKKFPNAAEKSKKATELFTRFGLSAFINVSGQLKNGVKDLEGNVLTGAAALKYLRTQINTADGSAKRFADRLLDTFAGQKTLLKGTLETFAIVLGKPFASVFKPFIGALVDGLNVVLKFFKNLPDPAKKFIAAIITAAGVVMTFAGGLGLIAGLGAVVAPFLLVAVKIFLGLTVALLPVIAAFGLLAVAIGVFVIAAKKNIGGFGDFVTKTFGKVKLIFNGIVQAFRDGGFSGAIRDELNKAENAGIRRFVINVFALGMRIKTFLVGIKDGFVAALDSIAPAFEGVKNAFMLVGQQLGIFGGTLDGVAGGPMSGFKSKGAQVGALLARMAGLFARLVQFALVFASVMIDTWKMIKPVVVPIINLIIFLLDHMFKKFQQGIAVAKVISDLVGGEGAGNRDVQGPGQLQTTPNAPPVLTPEANRKGAETLASISTQSIGGGFGGSAAIEAMLKQIDQSVARPMKAEINLNVDGEKLATVAANATRSLQSDGFTQTTAGV